MRAVLLPDAQTVIVLDDASPEALVATVIGGVGAGLRVDDAVLAESGEGVSGTIQFALPRSTGNQRDVAIHSASDPAGPFQITEVESAIADIAVAVMQLRGEPTRFERILSEVLLGLDHLGHLRRLVGTPDAGTDEQNSAPSRERGFFGLVGDRTSDWPDRDDDGDETQDELELQPGDEPEQQGIAWDDLGPASDPVRLTLEMIRKELRRPGHARLAEIDDDLWWLLDTRDLGAAKQALSERLEWGIFSLLTTGGGHHPDIVRRPRRTSLPRPGDCRWRSRGGVPVELSLDRP